MDKKLKYEKALNLYNSSKFIECIELIGENNIDESLNLIKSACHESIGEISTSEQILKGLISKNINNLNAFNNLALIYIKANKKNEAYSLLKHILNNDSTHNEALTNIAILCKDLNKKNEGLQYFKTLHDKNLLTFKNANDYSMLLLKAGLINDSDAIKNHYKLTYKFKIKYNEN